MSKECISCGVDTITPVVNGCLTTYRKHEDWCLCLAAFRLYEAMQTQPIPEVVNMLQAVCEKFNGRPTGECENGGGGK